MRCLREIKDQIVLEERVVIDECVTYYFVAPKEILSHYIPEENYNNAVSACISIDFPNGTMQDYRNADFMITPTERDEDSEGNEYLIDTDWRSVYLTQDDFDVLFELVNVNKKGE